MSLFGTLAGLSAPTNSIANKGPAVGTAAKADGASRLAVASEIIADDGAGCVDITTMSCPYCPPLPRPAPPW